MQRIEVDDEVFNVLKQKAEPFVDTPNTVLRRLLIDGERGGETASRRGAPAPRPAQRERRQHEVSSESFVRSCWSAKLSGRPTQVGRYRMMLESDTDVAYFQNFNKRGSPNLWYRLSRKPLELMRSKGKKAWVCFTNPAEGFGYLIPLDEIDGHQKAAGWDREDLEVNIDVAEDRWRELDWRLQSFRFHI